MLFYLWLMVCMTIMTVVTKCDNEDHKYFPLVQDRAYINGDWVEAKSGLTFSVFNPCNGSEVASVPDMDIADVQAAVRAASAAFPAWSTTAPKVCYILIFNQIGYLFTFLQTQCKLCSIKLIA